jgi:NodT family efflux transporter outer membrane factor (OMF) lipoprotein
VILDNSVAAFQRALDLTRNRFAGGIASQADVALAETQLESTRAQAVDLGDRRASLEHAIAVLTGKPPSTLQLPSSPLSSPPPDIPMGLPSDLLERRPDIAAAERRIAAAGAEVGIAQTAFFPRLLLTASAGFESRSLSSWLTGLSSFWSAGPAVAATLFDGGRRRAVSAQTRAAYDETVAFYQATILQSLQEVDDSLATLRVLRQEADIQAAAVAAAERSVTLATNRYRGGVTSYLEVITAQNAALTNQRAAVSILSRRLTASVLLIKALGGGWNAASLPALKTDTPR